MQAGQGNVHAPQCPWESWPHCSAACAEVWLPASSTCLAMSLGGGGKPRVTSPSTVAVQKLAKLGKWQLLLAFLAPVLFLMANSQMRGFLNGNFMLMFCFSPHGNEILSFLQCKWFGLQHA